MDAPPVQYVKTSDGYNIAFSVEGEGDPWVIVPPGFHHLRVALEEEEMAAWVQGLSDRFTLIRYDARGQGLSSRSVSHLDSFDDLAVDLEAVLDRVKPAPVVLHGIGSSVHVAVRFAARHPERVRALILVHCSITSEPWPRVLMDLLAQEDWESFLRAMTNSRGTPAGSTASMEHLREMILKEDFIKVFHAFQASDIGDLCRLLRMPALVLHLREMRRPSLQETAEVAAQIPNSRLADIGGWAPWFWGDFNSAIPLIEDFLSDIPAGKGAALESSAPDNLSPREAEVLRLIAAGRSNQEIAGELVISVNTVNRHVSNIFDKIGVANRSQATAYAKDRGLA